MHPRKPVFWYSPDEGASGSPDTGSTTPHAEGNGGPDQKTLDRQFAERARRAEEAERKRLLEAAGVKDEAELHAIVKAKAEADEAAKSELQKAADKAIQAELALEALKAENAGKLDELKRQLLDTDIKFAALIAARDRDGKVIRSAFRPEAMTEVLLLVNRSGITSENGEPAGIEKALAELAKAKPYLLAEDPRTPSKGTPVPGQQQQRTPSSGNEPPRGSIIGSL